MSMLIDIYIYILILIWLIYECRNTAECLSVY